MNLTFGLVCLCFKFKHMKYSEISRKLESANFDLYLSTSDNPDSPEIMHEIFTCLSGRYDGEVVDLFFNWFTGDVVNIEYSAQFQGQQPKFSI